MTFDYLSDLHRKFSAGDRLWVCAVRLNPSKTRFVRLCPPTEVELVITKIEADEPNLRAASYMLNYAAPIKNGKPDFKKAIGLSSLHFFYTKNDAIRAYKELLQTNMKEAEDMRGAVCKMKMRLDKEWCNACEQFQSWCDN